MTKTYLELLLETPTVMPETLGATYNQGEELYRRKWGFTIYRTVYSSGSDEDWETLLNRLRAEAEENVRASQAYENDPLDRLETVLSLFQLDPRSDSDALQGASMDRLRHVFQNSGCGSDSIGGGMVMNYEPGSFQLFLLADEEVLASVAKGEFWVKCVEVVYDPEQQPDKHTAISQRRLQNQPQRYFGWIKMTTRSLADLWQQLCMWPLDRVVNSGGRPHHENIWDSWDS